MGDNHVSAPPTGLVNDCLRGVKRHEHFVNRCLRSTCNESDFVPPMRRRGRIPLIHQRSYGVNGPLRHDFSLTGCMIGHSSGTNVPL